MGHFKEMIKLRDSPFLIAEMKRHALCPLLLGMLVLMGGGSTQENTGETVGEQL